MHQKHPKLSRIKLGNFARTEFALVGTKCVSMEAIMDKWLLALKDQFACQGITGDHGTPKYQATEQVGSRQAFSFTGNWNDYDDRLSGTHYDLVLVNGNHYPASKQIVFVDPKKAGTLERRQEQLTDIVAIVLCPAANEIPAWLQAQIAEQGKQSLPTYTLAEAEQALLPMIKSAAEAAIPPLKALILAGGKSSRMGTDKAQLVYQQDQTEAERLVEMCQKLGLDTYFSLHESGVAPVEGIPVIRDRFLALGPMGAIASAFLQQPATAWLVIACDLPLLRLENVQALLAKRAPNKYATAVKGGSQPFPEPLIAIYEPRAYQRLLQFLSIGYACPRKLLINSDIATLEFEDETALTNANTPADREEVMKQLAAD